MTAVYSEDISTTARSVFTDKGPIGKPALVLRTGTTGSFLSPTRMELSVGNLTSDLVGRYLRVSGSGRNDGEYLIVAVPAGNRVDLRASFSLPDTSPTSWSIVDPRDGQIADDPSHVRVRVNGIEVVPEEVIGLLGQVVLPTEPPSGAVVEVDYSWVPNPTVAALRFNSKEFRLNSWNRNPGHPAWASGHHYRYNNVLVAPAHYNPSRVVQSGTEAVATGPSGVSLVSGYVLESFVGLTLRLVSGGVETSYRIASRVGPTEVTVNGILTGVSFETWAIVDEARDALARLTQPERRSLHYRAYERAYTAILNDPNLLVLNSPVHKIAYPPLQRVTQGSFVSYEPFGLPDDPAQTYPWVKAGVGSVGILANRLILGDTLGNYFPDGEALFWTREVDQTFRHAFAMAWRMNVLSVPEYDGVFSGLAAGYSTDRRVVMVGAILHNGTRKIGLLRAGYGDNPGDPLAWTGGLDSQGTPTGEPIELDWNSIHDYRVYRGQDGLVKVYLDGEVVPVLQAVEEDLPFLEEIAAPFGELQQVFWGSLSRVARSSSAWDFVRYQVLPLNPFETAPSVWVSYEGTSLPESAPQPWTPVGYHGTSTLIAPDKLLVESTSATDAATANRVGLVGADFRGYFRAEPLLSVSSDVVLDIALRGLSSTHGPVPDGLMAAIDDGTRLTQLAWVADRESPHLSYGGRSLPTQWSPYVWTAVGSATPVMIGRTLRIQDNSSATALVYLTEDTSPLGAPNRVVDTGSDYVVEFRCRVVSYQVSPTGFAGVSGDVYDGARTIGVLLRHNGAPEVCFHSDGTVKSAFPFAWNDEKPHTYRVAKNTLANEVFLYVDNVFVGSCPYTSFDVPSGGSSVGVVSFGSSSWDTHFISTGGSGAISVVDWSYMNAWRVLGADERHLYAGIWKGTRKGSLLDFHLPLRYETVAAEAIGNVVRPLTPIPGSVSPGDALLIDSGPNEGVYRIVTVTSSQVTLDRPLPFGPSAVNFRVPAPLDWQQDHRYRLVRSPAGSVALFLDADTEPLLRVPYGDALAESFTGVPSRLAGGLPSVSWGSFDPTQLSSTLWGYVRYGATRAPNELRLAPHHQVLNQRNVMASPGHLRTPVVHSHTDYWSSSTGVPPQGGVPQTGEQDLFRNTSVTAYTELNEGTPLVPSTQTSEVRVPTPVMEFVSSFNRPEDVLNVDGDFLFNDGTVRHKLLVPDDVLYNSLEVIEHRTGETGLVAPMDDSLEPVGYALEWRRRVCLAYDGTDLPENAPDQPTPWSLVADDPSHTQVSTSVGVLRFATDAVGTSALYRNPTLLPDAPSLSTEVTFRVRVAQDGTLGLGDSQVRLGFSATGMTLALAFVTLSTGPRMVLVVDQKAQTILGGIPFDYLDGNFHTYRMVRDPGRNTVTITAN